MKLFDKVALGDYVLAGTTNGGPWEGFAVGGVLRIHDDECRDKYTVWTADFSGCPVEVSFPRVEQIALDEGKYFLKYKWQIALATFPSLWWRLHCLREEIGHPEDHLFSSSGEELGIYATESDLKYREEYYRTKDNRLSSYNLFSFPAKSAQCLS